MKIKNISLMIIMILLFSGASVPIFHENVVSAANSVTSGLPTDGSGTNSKSNSTDSCAGSFLGFPAWYRGLTDGSCNIKSPEAVGGISTFIWRIALNCIEMAMVAIGYLAAFYLIYGGFLFMTSTGDPADAAKARKTMINAIAGLGISIVAVVVINFIFTKLLG